MKTTKILLLLLITLLSACHVKKYNQQADNKNPDAKEVLLLGTFHYNNPGADVVKSDVFDVMSDDGQKQVEELANKIVKYNPSKIFTEWEVEDQDNLDSAYEKYLNGSYFDNENLSNFQRKNEIFQLAFRVAKKLKYKKVYAIDSTENPFDYPLVIEAMSENNQDALKANLEQTLKSFGEEASNDAASLSLEEIYLKTNTHKHSSKNIELYTETLIKAGSLQNSAGADVVAQWYKRNLRMWANIQKQVTQEDKRVMVLLGSGHTAILDQIIAYNSQWKVADLRKILTGHYYEAEF